MLPYQKIGKIPYGGDYNPEQWQEEIWDQDMIYFQRAGIDIVTLNVFSWAALQPDENTYDFSGLDRIMEMVKNQGLKVCLATSTGAHPAWMARKYPDILRVEFDGRKRKFGGRHNSCPNSPSYHWFSKELVKRLAERYRDYDNIIAWHVSNEFGGECFCENCERAFRKWLQEKYQTIESLNRAWNTSFWSHTFYDWEDIVLPDLQSEHFAYERTMFQGISLDYRRFMSDSLMNCYIEERDIIREVMPDTPVTTNLMGFYKPLDYFKWAKEMDFISWDNYPSNGDSYAQIAMGHDLMRGIKDGDPFALMEQTPSVTNWQPYNSLKRPGVMRLWSYQAVAHGADTVMFFQMRRSIGACEKYHGAVIDHAGTDQTRVFGEIAELGAELETIGDRLLGARTKSEIALMFDWDNWWALEYSAGPSQDLKYLNEFRRFYETLREMNYNVDIVGADSELSSYKIVIAPVLYMVKYHNDDALRNYVKNGGRLIVTFFSGIVQENDLVTLGGYPGKLRDILGIWVEEQDALPIEQKNHFRYKGKQYEAQIIYDLLHLEGAVQIDESGYLEDFYRGKPVLTENRFGKGKAYYIATASEKAFYRDFLGDICGEAGVFPVLKTPEGVEVCSRENGEKRFIFVMNHSEADREILLPAAMEEVITGQSREAGPVKIKGRDVHIYEQKIGDGR